MAGGERHRQQGHAAGGGQASPPAPKAGHLAPAHTDVLALAGQQPPVQGAHGVDDDRVLKAGGAGRERLWRQQVLGEERVEFGEARYTIK